jgi:hypothetical protein
MASFLPVYKGTFVYYKSWYNLDIALKFHQNHARIAYFTFCWFFSLYMYLLIIQKLVKVNWKLQIEVMKYIVYSFYSLDLMQTDERLYVFVVFM